MTDHPAAHIAKAPTIAQVRSVWSRPLPGLAAQLRLAPAYRAAELRERTPPPDPKQAGVLILLYPCNSQLCLPVTRRTDTVESHKGQVSLPGGAREGGEALEATAVRETCEELGVCPDRWDILGPLTPLYIPPSGFLIYPYVAYTPVRPAFQPDPVEVAELIEVPLSLLLDPATIVREDWLLRGTTVQVPFFYTYGHKVWGATAMVLSEFVALLNESRP